MYGLFFKLYMSSRSSMFCSSSLPFHQTVFLDFFFQQCFEQYQNVRLVFFSDQTGKFFSHPMKIKVKPYNFLLVPNVLRFWLYFFVLLHFFVFFVCPYTYPINDNSHRLCNKEYKYFIMSII